MPDLGKVLSSECEIGAFVVTANTDESTHTYDDRHCEK